MDPYKKSDTVQELFQEIENLIDNKKSPSENDYNFERPILIESDSDEFEEIIEPVSPMHTISTCCKCNKPIALGNSLEINLCTNCEAPKKRARSRSFTFDIGQFADKVKQSLQLPQSTGRRKSMPSMNEAYLEPPGSRSSSRPSSRPGSRPGSRPSSRASSFIEDVKQFLAPLSRKSSRNSLFQDFQKEEKELRKSSSNNSLLEALNPYKPKRAYSYEKRVISQENGLQKENEIEMLNSQQIPILKRKEIKKIEPREERVDIYEESAYVQCMKTKTGLMSWITKQAQKGPPDAWFGYTPLPKEPKKFLGIFKRKVKTGDLRQQQLQLSDDLLNRLPSLSYPLYDSERQATEDEYEPESYGSEIVSSPCAMDIPTTQQPVSILKKTYKDTNSSYDYEDEYEDEYEEPNYEDPYYEDQTSPIEPRYTRRERSHHRRPREDYFGYQKRSSRVYDPHIYSTDNIQYRARNKKTVSMNHNDQYYTRSYYPQRPKRATSRPILDDWEMILDDLCDMFPKFDRFFIDEVLVTARGNFDIAKDSIMAMTIEM